MKIEFKKIPQEKKEFNTSLNSVKIEGTFCRISSSLVKIEASLIGNIEIDCSRCGALDTLVVNEELKLLLSDGVFKGDEDEFLVIEIELLLVECISSVSQLSITRLIIVLVYPLPPS